jgi:hypothetical protein
VGGTNREVAEREVEPVKPKGCAVSVENADDPRSLSDGVWSSRRYLFWLPNGMGPRERK